MTNITLKLQKLLGFGNYAVQLFNFFKDFFLNKKVFKVKSYMALIGYILYISLTLKKFNIKANDEILNYIQTKFTIKIKAFGENKITTNKT